MKEHPKEFEECCAVHRNAKPSWNGFIKALTYEEMVVARNLFLNTHMKKLKHYGLRKQNLSSLPISRTSRLSHTASWITC